MSILNFLKPKSSLSELESARTKAVQELAQAAENLESARAKAENSLLAVDETVTSAAYESVKMEEVRLRRAQAALDAIGERIEQAQSNETEAQRKAKYADAKRESEEAAAHLLKLDTLSQEQIRIFAKAASAVLAVEAVNADLPDGVEPLMRPDDIAAGKLPRKIIEERNIVQWIVPNVGTPLGAEEAQRVEDRGDETGRLPPVRNSDGSVAANEMIVRKRVRTQQTFLPSTEYSGPKLPVSAATRLVSSSGAEVWSGWGPPKRIIEEAAKALELIRASAASKRDEREPQTAFRD